MTETTGIFNAEAAKATESLFKAAAGNDDRAIVNLVANGAVINAVNENGLTPLMLAVEAGKADNVAELMKLGANENLTNQDGLTARALAAAKSDQRCEKEIDEGVFRRAQEALFSALRKKDVPLVKTILAGGGVSDLDRWDRNHNWTPLRLAICEESLDCVKALLEAGAKAEIASGREMETPLGYAIGIFRPDPRIVEALLEHGAKPATKSGWDKFPLGTAAARGLESICHLLLDHGADPDQVFGRGCTAAHVAAKHGNVGVIRILSDHGANLDVENTENQTPLLAAVMHRRRSAYEALAKAGADTQRAFNDGLTLLMQTAWAGEADIIPDLLRRGADINARSANGGYTALMYAAWAGKSETVRALLDAGADLEMKNDEGKYALQMAQDHGHAPIAALIFDHMKTQVKSGIDAPAAVNTPYRLKSRRGSPESP